MRLPVQVADALQRVADSERTCRIAQASAQSQLRSIAAQPGTRAAVVVRPAGGGDGRWMRRVNDYCAQAGYVVTAVGSLTDAMALVDGRRAVVIVADNLVDVHERLEVVGSKVRGGDSDSPRYRRARSVPLRGPFDE